MMATVTTRIAPTAATVNCSGPTTTHQPAVPRRIHATAQSTTRANPAAAVSCKRSIDARTLAASESGDESEGACDMIRSPRPAAGHPIRPPGLTQPCDYPRWPVVRTER